MARLEKFVVLALTHEGVAEYFSCQAESAMQAYTRLDPEKRFKEVISVYKQVPLFNWYRLSWSKRYHASGEISVQALSKDEALAKGREMIGDLEGSMRYDPEGDVVEIIR